MTGCCWLLKLRGRSDVHILDVKISSCEGRGGIWILSVLKSYRHIATPFIGLKSGLLDTAKAPIYLRSIMDNAVLRGKTVATSATRCETLPQNNILSILDPLW